MSSFDPKLFLSTAGAGREVLAYRRGQKIYAQGDASDAVFVIRSGHIRLSSKSRQDKEATIDLLGEGDFFGNDSIADEPVRTASAAAMSKCGVLRIEKETMKLALASEISLLDIFCKYILVRNLRYQQDLVDQRCNPSEKRLARILLQYARFDGESSRQTLVPKVSHETLAQMVGTTRSRVCFFMKRFKTAGFIDYKLGQGELRVRRSLCDFYASEAPPESMFRDLSHSNLKETTVAGG